MLRAAGLAPARLPEAVGVDAPEAAKRVLARRPEVVGGGHPAIWAPWLKASGSAYARPSSGTKLALRVRSMLDGAKDQALTLEGVPQPDPAFYKPQSMVLDFPRQQEYIRGMKVKTSITLTEELLTAIDKRARQFKKNRSDFIEAAVRAFIGQLIRDELNAKDLEIINRRADFLNQEASDVLAFQAPL